MNRGSLIGNSGFWAIEKLGQERLSKHFFMRQFLYSEIASHFSVPNFPTDPELALENGRRLCEDILEPIVSAFGPIVVRSGYRSPVVNAIGASKGLKCASNVKNAGVHIWDSKDDRGCAGAACCIVVPHLVDSATSASSWQGMATWLVGNIPFHKVSFFTRDFAFNIGWNEKPLGEVYSNLPPRGVWRPN